MMLIKAAEKLPSMIPTNRREPCDRTKRAKNKITTPKINAPSKALEINPQSDWKKEIPVKSVMATNKLAPVLTPKMFGSASGFLKIVCINKPASDKPAPAMIAVIVRGILRSRAIMWWVLE